jgi:hypothetical protein
LLRTAAVGGAIVGTAVAGGGVLAATHQRPGSELWKAALVAVVVLAVLGIALLLIGGAYAFLTRPVSDGHAAVLKASAVSLAQSLGSGKMCDHGDGYRPGQAFRAHFPALGRELADWDEVVAAPDRTRHALDTYINSLMAERKMTGLELGVAYNVTEIKKYAAGLAMARAQGVVPEVPDLDWAGFSTAGGNIPGPPEGKLRPNGSIADWISLEPLPGETGDEWRERAESYTQCVDAFVATVYADISPHGQAVLTAERRLEDFKRDRLPATLEALQLVQEREAPRVRHGCESC